jgi:hypothetical protein
VPGSGRVGKALSEPQEPVLKLEDLHGHPEER